MVLVTCSSLKCGAGMVLCRKVRVWCCWVSSCYGNVQFSNVVVKSSGVLVLYVTYRGGIVMLSKVSVELGLLTLRCSVV